MDKEVKKVKDLLLSELQYLQLYLEFLPHKESRTYFSQNGEKILEPGGYLYPNESVRIYSVIAKKCNLDVDEAGRQFSFGRFKSIWNTGKIKPDESIELADRIKVLPNDSEYTFLVGYGKLIKEYATKFGFDYYSEYSIS